MLPSDPGFHEILGSSKPPSTPAQNFIYRAGSMVAEAVNADDLEEYLEGGEYDERMDEIGHDLLYLPISCEPVG